MLYLSEDGKHKIEQIYNVYYSTMLFFAKRILTDDALAEDAVHASVEKLIANLEKVGDVLSSSTKAYVCVIVKNTALNILARIKRIAPDSEEMLPHFVDPSPDILEELLSNEGYTEMVNAFDGLPTALADVAYLALVREISQKEIAILLGITDGTVRTRLSRAKEVLRNAILKRGERDGSKQ